MPPIPHNYTIQYAVNLCRAISGHFGVGQTSTGISHQGLDMEHTNNSMSMLSITFVLVLLLHAKISAVKKVYLASVHLMGTSYSTTNYLYNLKNIILCNFRSSVQKRMKQIWISNISILHIRTLEIFRELDSSFVVSEM